MSRKSVIENWSSRICHLTECEHAPVRCAITDYRCQMPDVRFQDSQSMNDLKVAFRQLLKNPDFADLAVPALAPALNGVSRRVR